MEGLFNGVTSAPAFEDVVKQARRNILKALAAVVSICGSHVILLPNINPRYFT
jgi:hypothetical protein